MSEDASFASLHRRYRAGIFGGPSTKMTIRLRPVEDGLEVEAREDGLFRRWDSFLLGPKPGYSKIPNTPEAIAAAWSEIDGFSFMTRID